jgi:UDP-N-acetylmuramate dehydrogenase
MGPFNGLEHIVRENEPLASYTWLRLGGPAQYFAEPTTMDELAELIRRSTANDLAVHVLGGGSNLLIRESGVKGLVVHLSAPAFSQISTAGNQVTAGAGAKLGHVISTAVRDGLAGLEPLAGIPGTVGGALLSNVDASGSSLGQWTSKVTMMTRAAEIVEQQGEQLRFSYRKSSLDELVILAADFTLEPGDAATLTKRMQKFWIVKQASQPPANENPACMFKDVGGISAGSLIEQAGFKGTAVRDASVSERDGCFVIANPGATSDDVIELIETLRKGVEEQLGVELETQLQIW